MKFHYLYSDFSYILLVIIWCTLNYSIHFLFDIGVITLSYLTTFATHIKFFSNFEKLYLNKFFGMSNIMAGFKSTMKSLDIFGSPINFNIGGVYKYKSAVGGVLTLLMVAILILFFQVFIIINHSPQLRALRIVIKCLWLHSKLLLLILNKWF